MNWVPSLLWGCFGFGRGAEQCGWNFRKSDVTNDERWAFYLGTWTWVAWKHQWKSECQPGIGGE